MIAASWWGKAKSEKKQKKREEGTPCPDILLKEGLATVHT